MKKIILAVILGLLMCGVAVSADDSQVSRQLDRLETIIYGSARKGGLLTRLDTIEKDLYGTGLQGTLAERQTAHMDFLERGTNGQPSLLFKLSVAEWALEIPNNGHLPLVERIPIVEQRLEGSALNDRPLAMRVERINSMVMSDTVSAVPTNVPAGVVARLQLMQTLRPADAKKDDVVLFRLTHNILVDGKLVAAVGMPASGVITSVKKPRSFGRPSEIKIELQTLDTLTGIPLQLVEGKSSKEAAEFEVSYAAAAGTSLVGAIALGPVGLAGGFFIRGNAKDVPEGSIMYAETANPATVPGYLVPDNLRSLIGENVYVDLTSGEKNKIERPEKPEEAGKPAPAPVRTEADSL